LFERNRDEQIAFFANLFVGKKSILSDEQTEATIANLVLFAGEGSFPRHRKSLLTVIFECLYQSMDFWDKGQLLSELIVDSQVPYRNDEFIPPQHTPERAVRILRLIKGFGPKAAQILRSHRAILGESAEADRYRTAFEDLKKMRSV